MPRSSSDTRLLALHAGLAALTPLVPAVLLDERLEDAVRRSLVRRLADRHRRRVGRAEIDLLAGIGERRRSLRAALRAGPRAAGVRLGRAIFRKTFAALALERAVRTASRTFQEGWLLDVALGEGTGPVARDEARRVRALLDEAMPRAPRAGLEQGFRELLRNGADAAREAAETLARRFRERGTSGGSDVDALGSEREHAALLGTALDRMTAVVDRQRAQLERTAEAFRGRVRAELAAS